MGTVTPLREPGEPTPYLAPPYNPEAEQALLGALLISNRAYDRVIEIVRESDFGSAVHARIFAAIGKMIDRGQAANPVTLKSVFDQDGTLADLGGSRYLVDLAQSATRIIAAEDYAHTVAELAQRRAIMAACQETIRDAARLDIDRSASDILSDCDRALAAVSERGESRAMPVVAAYDQAAATAERVYQADGKVIGVTTGLIDLDHKLGGLHNGDLVILAARPGMGKSALAGGIADAAARSGVPTLFFSLEMSAEQLAARQIAAITGVSAEEQRSGPLSREDIAAIIDARKEVASLPLVIDEDRSARLPQIRARCRRAKRRNNLGLVIIDYIGLMLDGKPQFIVQEMSALTRGLKKLAGDLNVPIVALSQLNRAVEARDDKRPMLADLRESGSIEQDADVVMFIYREEYYHQHTQPKRKPNDTDEKFAAAEEHWQAHLDSIKGLAEVLIRKNRHGAENVVKLHFNGRRTTFENLAWQR